VPAIRNTEAPAAAPAASSHQSDVQRAQEELAQAQKNLEAGRQVRYGNERNYARYQQRIQGLEQAVQNARQKLEQAQGGQIAD
jgi:predicted  nucleic acid-binding Zn-ribbon protein